MLSSSSNLMPNLGGGTGGRWYRVVYSKKAFLERSRITCPLSSQIPNPTWRYALMGGIEGTMSYWCMILQAKRSLLLQLKSEQRVTSRSRQVQKHEMRKISVNEVSRPVLPPHGQPIEVHPSLIPCVWLQQNHSCHDQSKCMKKVLNSKPSASPAFSHFSAEAPTSTKAVECHGRA